MFVLFKAWSVLDSDQCVCLTKAWRLLGENLRKDKWCCTREKSKFIKSGFECKLHDHDISHTVIDESSQPLCVSDHAGHSHITFCVLEKLNDGYSIKTIKQKQCVDGLLYILQEFYGIENKENEHAKVRMLFFAINCCPRPQYRCSPVVATRLTCTSGRTTEPHRY